MQKDKISDPVIEESIKKGLIAHSKCLIAGGYSILFPGAKGVVFSLEDHFTASIEAQTQIYPSKTYIEVYSPQFQGQAPFQIDITRGLSEEARFPFVEVPILVALAYFRLKSPDAYQKVVEGVSFYRIRVLQTKGYISTKNHVVKDGADSEGGKGLGSGQIPEFGELYPLFDREISECSKTGIGSSSGIIVILIKAVLELFGELEEDIVHFLAQIANSIAQKKIGSGFDITAAVYGSSQFTRIPKDVVEDWSRRFQSLKIEDFDQESKGRISTWDPSNNPLDLFLSDLQTVSKSKKSKPLPWSQKYKIILLEYSSGFNTRIAVKKMVRFLNANEQQKIEFLDKSNQAVTSLINILGLEIDLDYKEARKINLEYRKLLKDFGRRAEVEIEPDLATILLDLFLSKFSSRVVYGLCPGAGGYDDIAFLVKAEDKESLLKEMQKLADSLFDSNDDKKEGNGLKLLKETLSGLSQDSSLLPEFEISVEEYFKEGFGDLSLKFK